MTYFFKGCDITWASIFYFTIIILQILIFKNQNKTKLAYLRYTSDITAKYKIK